MKYFLILLVAVGLHAFDNGIEGLYTGIKTTTMVIDAKNDIYNGSEKQTTVYAQLAQASIDYTNDNWHFSVTPFGYIYDTQDGSKMKNNTFYDPYEKQAFWFRSLYVSYTSGNWTLGAGILPFSNSAPAHYNDDYIEDGEGILLLNDSVLNAVFALYKTENSRTIFGWGTPEQIFGVNSGDYTQDELKEDCYSVFAINTYNKDKFKYTTQAIYHKLNFDKNKLGDTGNLNVNVVWDDSEETGLSLYGTVAASYWRSEAKHSKESIENLYFGRQAAQLGIPATALGSASVARSPQSFEYNKYDTFGGAHQLGFRYDFEVKDTEFFVNAEWTHVYGNWMSGSPGSFYLGKNNSMYNMRDNSYYAQVGWVVNQNLRIRLSHTIVEIDESSVIGAPAKTIPHYQSIKTDKITKQTMSTLLITLRF